jgi:hypothetical protein
VTRRLVAFTAALFLALAPAAQATILQAPDWTTVPDGARAPDNCTTAGRTVFPGLKNTPWNVRCGGPSAVKQTVDGKAALAFTVPANFRHTDGDTANAGRAELEPDVPNLQPGTTVYWGYDFKASAFPSQVAWNLAGQLKSDGTGSPPFGISLHGQAGPGFGAVDVYTNQKAILFTDATIWHRVVWQLSPAAPGQRGTVAAWVDGVKVLDTPWTLILAGRNHGYLKFGLYAATASFARTHYFARMILATTLQEAQGGQAPPSESPPAENREEQLETLLAEALTALREARTELERLERAAAELGVN